MGREREGELVRRIFVILCCLHGAVETFRVNIAKEPYTVDTPKGPVKFTPTAGGVIVNMELKGLNQEDIQKIKESIRKNSNLLPVEGKQMVEAKCEAEDPYTEEFVGLGEEVSEQIGNFIFMSDDSP